MKPKPNKNLRLPLTTQREKASGNHQILSPRKNLITISLSAFVFPGVLYQFFDLTDRVVVNDTLPQS